MDPSEHGMAALRPTDTMVDPSLERRHHIGITVYGDEEAQTRISALIDRYPQLFVDKGTTVDVPEAQHMPVLLRHDWQDRLPPPKAYPVGLRDREVIDKAFDPLQAAGKLEYTELPTPFAFPVFVVWKDVPDPERPGETIRKPRAVVDIRGLNRISVPDSYQIPLQEDIFAELRGARYISTMDAVSFFYQWLLAKNDKHKMTINTHRGQETFNVAVMGYCNSVQYVQRQLDGILRSCRTFARAYIDDIVVWSKTLEEHEECLQRVWSLLDARRVSLSPKKTFLAFPSTTLLGQRVSGLGLAAAEDRIKAIRDIDFPTTLKALELYVGLTNYLRNQIPYYAQLSAPQAVKSSLLKDAPNSSKNARKAYTQRTRVSLDDPALRESFNAIQSQFKDPHFLWHFDPTRPTYYDVDASHEFGFGCMIYMVKGDPPPDMDGNKARLFKKEDIQIIMFLSRALTGAETRYWPTELEVTGLVWMVKKVHHLIHASQRPAIIFSDHVASVGIATQTSLTTTTSTDKLNLKLVRDSAYLSQFRLQVVYRPGRIHIVPDALSRLKAYGKDVISPKVVPPRVATEAVDCHSLEVGSYHTLLVELSPEFKQRLIAGYESDPHWRNILEMVLRSQERRRIDDGAALEGQAVVRYQDGVDPMDGDEFNSPLGLRFFERHGLLYFRDFANGRDRLCIPTSMEREVFEIAHDHHHHQGVDRCHDRLRASVYIHHMLRRLRMYIDHCWPCKRNQTTRHPPYGELQPIQTEFLPFHTVTMDWIVALPEVPEDALLTTTCKATKRVALTPGFTTWTAQEWAAAWLTTLEIRDWSYPLQIISDRDPKFTSDFFTAMAKALHIKMCTTTAYHPQADGQSERTNQTVEIALRYNVTSHPDGKWTDCLPHLQATLNNSRNQTTGYTPNELLRGFNSNLDSLHALEDLPPADYEKLRGRLRAEAQDAVAWANAGMKARYDSKHKPLSFKEGDQVMLRLHHGYKILGHENRKLSHQREGPFRVKRKAGNLAYELELPPNYKIHPVVSVLQLEKLPQEPDPFERPQDHEPGPVAAQDDDAPAYEIERLIGRRIRTKRGRPVVQYLVKWLGYSAASNQWYDLENLSDALELVKSYDEAHPPGTPEPMASASRSPNSVIRQAPRRAGLRSAREPHDSPES